MTMLAVCCRLWTNEFLMDLIWISCPKVHSPRATPIRSRPEEPPHRPVFGRMLWSLFSLLDLSYPHRRQPSPLSHAVALHVSAVRSAGLPSTSRASSRPGLCTRAHPLRERRETHSPLRSSTLCSRLAQQSGESVPRRRIVVYNK